MEFSPADVVAALSPLLGAARCARIDRVAASRLGSVVAVLEDIRDPHNAGAALRSCEAMGVLTPHVITARERFRTSVRVTQGCEKWLHPARWFEVAPCVDDLHARGFRVLAGVPGAAPTLWQIDPLARVALCFGNEHLGLSPELRARCDGEFAIPMHGFSESLNVSVSVAVSLHVITERRRAALGRPGDLDDEEAMALRARYYARDLRGWEAVVRRYVEERERGAGE